MSSVWKTRHRLLLEWLEELVDGLSGETSVDRAVTEERVVRLAMGAVSLLRQHEVNKRGQCKFCGWTRWTMRFWRRRRQCTVYNAFVFAAGQSPDVVWWQLFEDVGRQCSLADVQEWLESRTQQET